MSIRITDEGMRLMEKSVLSGQKIDFRRIELIADPEKSPSEKKYSVDVDSVKSTDFNTIVIKAIVKNEGFEATYHFNRIEIYVNDEDVLFAYDACDICVPQETTKCINTLDVYLNLNSAYAEIKCVYESYIARKEFEELRAELNETEQKLTVTLQNSAAKDITDDVVWNTSCTSDRHVMAIGNIVMFKVNYIPYIGSGVTIATIPEQYIPQDSIPLNAITRSYADDNRYVQAEINVLNGNIDVQILDRDNNGSFATTNFPVTIEGFWFIASGDGMATVWESIVDNTLEQSGRAADSRVVGKAIKKIQGDVCNISATDEEANEYLYGGNGS